MWGGLLNIFNKNIFQQVIGVIYIVVWQFKLDILICINLKLMQHSYI